MAFVRLLLNSSLSLSLSTVASLLVLGLGFFCLSPVERQRSKVGIVFSSVCLRSVCLFVNTITLESLKISCWNLYGSNIWSKPRMSLKTGACQCTAAHRWWYNISACNSPVPAIQPNRRTYGVLTLFTFLLTDVLVFKYFLLVVFGCHYQSDWLLGKTCLWHDLLCVEWNVKLCSLHYSPYGWQFG